MAMSSVVLTRIVAARSANCSSTRIATRMSRQPMMQMQRRTVTGPADRPQGQDALVDLDPKKKMANYAMAVGCLAFVTGVWYYSISAVGKGDGEMEELERAAQKVTVHQSGYKVQTANASNNNAAQNVVSADVVDVGIAAPSDIAEEEERAAAAAAGVVMDDDDGADLSSSTNKGRSGGWRRIVFFWRKD
eukprot:CAMPEP_0196819210 /NCGR_PEP_ID=MMETSP1362-20130617/69547_1 /TAXON_ID=163516 /ORGANISM="Leptocylindrus danicus, Strain CCMP1856" /LENGTH=189 /DNA_ID=CAMNT_0042197609 /DNA_START=92 /DNA_END=661 /DNA_ORIENTATION=-